MKRIITLLLVIATLFSLASCGAVNDTDVYVLWSDMSDEYLATIADALDRAMYIKNIAHTDYDAEGKADKQLDQVDEAISSGAAALLVNATDFITAGVILEKEKKADMPLVFICNDFDLPAELIASYDKCAAVNVDKTTLYTTLGERVAEDLIENYEDYDRNGDGKISYSAFGLSGAAVIKINEKLKEAEKPELIANPLHLALPTVKVGEVIDSIFDGYDGSGKKVNETPVELILTDDDAYIEDMLLALREYELNHKKLVTHFIPLYTVGISANAGKLIESTKQEELDAYSVMSAIDNGYLSAAALENDDEIAICAATILRNLIKGDALLDDVNEEYVNERHVLVPYTIYG